MTTIGLMVVVSFVITFASIKVLQPVAVMVNLVDRPGGRKLHEGLIPLIGGIGVFLGVAATTLLFVEQSQFVRFLLIGAGFMVFLGMLDDRYDISPRFRLVGQVLIASIFVYGMDLYLVSFGNLFGLGDIQLGLLGYPLAILSLVGVVNAFNMLDGIDGLIGSLALISFCGLAYLFGVAGNHELQSVALALVAALSAFLLFNVWGCTNGKRSLCKVFMGDAGSMLAGLMVGVLLIAGSQGESAAFSPITAVWFVLLPMTDMFTLMYRRIKRGKSPVAPDRTHIHHILLRAGFGKAQTLAILVAVQALFVGAGLYLQGLGASWQPMACLIAVVSIGCYQLLMKRSWRFIRWSKRRFSPANALLHEK